MTNKLYIGNLSHDVTEWDLKYNFGEMGTCISARIIRDKQSGLSRGFAFVEMATEEEAQEVIRKCKGVELDGKMLVVKEARPKSKKSSNSSGPGSKRRRKR